MVEHPSVSIVIVTWNSRDEVLACLASLEANPPSQPWEVVVVDNASADGTVEAARRAAPWAKVIANRRNLGLAAANNQGLVVTTGAIVVVSNPDVTYRPGAIDALVTLFDRQPRAAFAVSKLLHPDGTVQTAAGDLPTLGEALLGRRAAARARAGTSVEPSGFWWHGWAHDEERAIGHGGEACYAVRRLALAEIGAQDQRFRLDWEGIDWSARAVERGWEVWFCPTAEVVHLGGASIAQARLRWIVQSHHGMYRYFRSRSPAALRPLVAAVITARAGAKLAATLAGRASYERAHRFDGHRC